MLGPEAASQRARSRHEDDDKWAWQGSRASSNDAECELCQSRTNTSLEYGMRVCPTCDEKLLP